MNNELEGMLT